MQLAPFRADQHTMSPDAPSLAAPVTFARGRDVDAHADCVLAPREHYTDYRGAVNAQRWVMMPRHSRRAAFSRRYRGQDVDRRGSPERAFDAEDSRRAQEDASGLMMRSSSANAASHYYLPAESRPLAWPLPQEMGA